MRNFDFPDRESLGFRGDFRQLEHLLQIENSLVGPEKFSGDSWQPDELSARRAIEFAVDRLQYGSETIEARLALKRIEQVGRDSLGLHPEITLVAQCGETEQMQICYQRMRLRDKLRE